MGCAPSRSSCKKGGIRLMTTRLTFTKGQLCNLNTYFRKLVDEAENDVSNAFAIEAIVERLVQRLMRGASNLDRRFSSMFLVSLNEPRRIKRLRFEYLLRIDALSASSSNLEQEFTSSVSVEEDASLPGFIHLKILGTGAKEIWREYIDVTGRLRRDLVKARLANLLATSIKDTTIDTEDDRICVSPGQVVDADILDKILKQPDHCRIFYGPGISDESLPRRRDRVAMIEDSEGILVRIGVDGAKSREVEVRLLIGIGLSSWPCLTDYPQRIPLYHCDALLHYTAAQTGMYAVAVGPCTGARCENRATLWRVRVPAAEKIMSQHYASDSVPSLTESVLLEILYELREGRSSNLSTKPKVNGAPSSEVRLRVVSRHILRTVHRWRLERVGPDPLTSWAPDTLSHHVLLTLDELVAALKCQNLRCYLYPRCNVMLQCARGGISHHEESYASDCRSLESYLETLHSYSFSITRDVARPLDLMENELIVRWREIIALPHGRGLNNDDYHGYSERQFEYLTMIVGQALAARDSLLQDNLDNRNCYSNLPELSYCATEQVESLVFLLKLVSTQAWDQIHLATERKMRIHDRYAVPRRKRHYNTTSQFDYSIGLLIDAVRNDRETVNTDLESMPVMTKMLLHWLHFGMENDRKILEPVLRPYLNNLFNGTREHGWLATSWKRREELYRGEMGSLSMFCKSVVTEEITPGNGIVDYLSKGWHWAENMARMIERSGNFLPLIFLPRDRTIKFDLTFAGNKGPSSFSTWSKVRSVSTIARRRRRSIYSRASELFDYLTGSQRTSDYNNGVAGHTELRDASPLTYVASMSRSRTRHRGPGDLISAIVSLGKFRVVQEAAAFLPREERVVVLDAVQRVAREFSRRSSRKTGSVYTSDSPRQLYRPRPETDLLDSPPRPLSPEIRERRIIAEHQKQLEKEIQEMHDTLRRDALRRQFSSCNTWDSNSLSSFNSSIDSIMGTITLRRYRTPIWDAIKGNSSVRSSLRQNHNTGKGKFNTEMISREESPTWSTTRSARSKELDYAESKNEDELPSWDALEATLNRRLCNYGDALPESLETDESVGEKLGEQTTGE
ncbi:uncharacterized protein LOC116185920 [Apis dorsata]|uniref:uncharacterized protein LOC116185920 n=1 Tax=Apis dorsata TaxID=7462 RepID=UPI00129320AB|nr:uncharacterized protein LOC116185920 [Apis dorsata]